MGRRVLTSSDPANSIYIDTIAADTPSHWYKFNSSSIVEDSVGNRDGFYTPAPSTLSNDNPTQDQSMFSMYSAYWAGGGPNVTRDFTIGHNILGDGSGAFQCPLDNRQSWTIEFWFKTGASPVHLTGGTRRNDILRVGYFNFYIGTNIGSTNYPWSVGVDIQSFSDDIYTRNSSRDYLASSKVSQDYTNYVNKWTHVVLTWTYSTETLKFYLNGSLKEQTTKSEMQSTTNDVWTGGTYLAPEYSSVTYTNYGSIPSYHASTTPSYQPSVTTAHHNGVFWMDLKLAQLAYYDYALSSTKVHNHYFAASQ